jgi:ABC-type phosphate transport system permease subunit
MNTSTTGGGTLDQQSLDGNKELGAFMETSSADNGMLDERLLQVVRKQRIQDFLFHKLTLSFSLIVLVSLIGIIVSLAVVAWPTFKKFGIEFIWRVEWDIINEEFGAAIAIFGTLASATIAILIAMPLSFGIALFLTETCPTWLRRPLGTAIELLAAVPSIIYGMFGLFIFAPLFAEYGQPALQSTLGQMPLIGPLFGGAMNGIGILAAGLILAFMILPFIAAVTRDGAADPARIGLRRGLHDLGSGEAYCAALHAAGCHRRRDAGPRPCARRNHGSHLCHRQLPAHQRLPVLSRLIHRVDPGERVRRSSGLPPVHSFCTGPAAVRDHFHSAGLRQNPDHPH